MQLIIPPISSPTDYLPLSWGPNDDLELACYRIYYGASSGNYVHIIDVGNIILYRASLKPHPQGLHDFRVPSLAKNHLVKYLPSRYSLPIAQNITPKPSLKATMRTSTTPLALLSEFLVVTTLTDKIVYLLFLLCYSLCIFSWLIKKHPDI